MKILQYGIVLLCIVTLWGCSDGNSNVPTAASIDPATNKHPVGMAVAVSGGAHVDAYYTNPSYCIQCHGEMADLKGGISKVSCSTVSRSGISCHAGKWPHGNGYAAFNLHGNTARSAATGFNGMAYCKKCHGSDYNGTSGLGVSCIGCHNGADGSNAPHAANWKTGRVVNGINNGIKHGNRVDETNAAACAQCHLGGTFSHAPTNPAAKGTAPGCFNGTLCHNQAGHTPYTDVTHQADARDNAVCGLSCHATPATSTSNPRFNVPIVTSNGTPMSNGCETCHARPGLAHPYIWLANRGSGSTTHGNNDTTGIPGNILSACGTCHNVTAAGAKFGAPSCMSAAAGVPGMSPTIVCHFSSPVTGTNVTAGCNSCHDGLPSGPNGSSFPNIANAHPKHAAISGVTCSTCHNGAGNGTQLHANGVPDVLFLGSQAGVTAAYDAATKTCTNVTCHGLTTTPAWTAINQGCTACHISPPSTFRHAAHWAITTDIKCDACHNDGPGVPTHTTQNPVVVGSPLPTKFYESGATATYATGLCLNVSCHGGKPNIAYGPGTFPAWKSTTVFNPTNNCYNCHLQRVGIDPGLLEADYRAAVTAGTKPYIGPFSGKPASSGNNNMHFEHFFQIGGTAPAVCLHCHVTPGAGHFANVMTGRRNLPRGFAAGTVSGPTTEITSYDTTTGTCASTCHTTTRTWY